MKRSLVLVLGAVAAVAAVLLLSGPARPRITAAAAADVPASTSGIVVDGLGRASGTPDVLRVVLGVSVHRADVSSALAEANTRQTRLRDVLRRGGVADKDLQTSDVSISQHYGNRGPDGYEVDETLTAKLRDLGRAGRLLTAAVSAAGNEAVLQGVSFSLEDNASLIASARDNAFADAKAKAERYAQLAGRTLGQVELVTESTTQPTPQPYPMYDSAAAGKALAAVPLNPGTTDLTVSVTVRWALR